MTRFELHTTPFWFAYRSLLLDLHRAPAEVNKRTGVCVKVLFGGVSFSINLQDQVLPTCGLRMSWPRVAAAEIAWYISGERDATWMRQHAPIWDKFVEPLEKLRINDEGYPYTEEFEGVASAYGYRWRNHFGRDQLRLAIEALRNNPTDRRVVVSAWDPSEDGLGAEGQKNVPCPAMFTLSISEGHLHSTMLLRSSDVFVGLPYDVLGHALLMDAIACEIGVSVGIAHFTLAHAHLYESHWDMAVKAVSQDPVVPMQFMPGWALTNIEKDRDGYVETVKAQSASLLWPKFRPSPEVVA